MVSMKDVALACNVSVATVSKALNNHNDISEAKREEIKKKAKEMGYFPNISARALKTNRTYSIGVLFVDEARSGLTHDYFVAVLESFKVTAEKKGYDITFLNCNKSRSNRLSYLEHARFRGFDGVVIACIDFSDPEVMELVESDIPVVTIDHLFNNRISIVSDNIKGMRDLLTYIYNHGHRKIAYIHGMESAVTSSRLSSFYKTAEELGLVIPDEYVKEAGYRDTDMTAKRTRELLDLKEPPTCIIFPDDYAAFGGINAIKKRGLRIPQDISVAGYDGIRVARQIEPAITTLAQNTKKLGRYAAEKLIGLIEKPKTTLIEQVIVQGELLEGATVGRIEL
ncbi:LacI family transcriptional regulator [Falcatimonas sp. MSJ-15]|uniref:LacI family DNA-binding transcriptional regulator n=1 Tax=Falcatimonas sp. MSJ-15 TaxID=2841515 RepID=UPI001C0FE6CB|nr:LacI family DNA-binding transcriptional regulator [Falcatimonas sp. MSJ-15]MBU5470575.1 LacI family transcriptional regulator [Falcatimonas sp. MSJ-15]